MFRHHSTDPAFAAAHADVESLYQRLGHDITTLDDDGDPVSRQALSDAGERYNTAGAQLGTAQSVAELAVVRAIVVEGLQATRVVRTHRGLDPGPDPATIAPPVTTPAAGTPGLGSLTHGHGGLGGLLGAGAVGGLLGMASGGILGELLGGDEGGGDWGGGGDGGDWGGE
jgi:hypothetical protein